MLTKEYLALKLASLQQQFKQLEANLNAANGAIQLTQHLMSEIDRLESEAKEKAEETAKKVIDSLES